MNTQDFQIGPKELQGSIALNPINLAVRFVLEIGALIALGAWGATLADGFLSLVMALIVVTVAALLWGFVGVPGDRGPNDNPRVRVPGVLRLMIEGLIFGGAVLALIAVDRPTWAMIFAVVTVIHYAISYERILWLVRR